MAEPLVSPLRKEEEISRTRDGQEIRRSVSRTPSEEVQRVTTQSTDGAGLTRRTTEQIAPTRAAVGQYSKTRRLFYAYQIVWYVLGFIEIVLGFRFILKIAGANPNSGFAEFIYGLSEPFAGPFIGLFPASVATGAATTSYAEWSTLVVMIVYALIAWGVVKLFGLSRPVTQDEVERAVAEE